MRTSGHDRRVAAAAAAIVGLVALVFAAQMLSLVNRPLGNDFTAYLMAARDLAAGRNPYAAQYLIPYRYPLFLAFVLIAVLQLPVLVAAGAWHVASIAAFVALFKVSLDQGFATDGFLRRLLISALAALFFIEIIQNDLLNGQVDVFVALACLVAATAAAPYRDAKAAGLLGIAIAVKLLPVLLLPFFVLRRRYAAAAGAIAVALIVSIAPAYLLGGPLAAYQPYWDLFVAPTLRRAPDSAAFLHRDVSVAGVVMSIGGWSANWLRTAISATVVGLAAMADLRRDRESDRADVIAASIYMVAMILVSPMSEIHYLVLALPAAIVAIGAALTMPWSDGWRWCTGVACALIIAGEIARAQRSVLFCAGLLMIAAAAAHVMAQRGRLSGPPGVLEGASVM